MQDKHSTFPAFTFSETESNCAAQVGLELRVLPSLLPDSWVTGVRHLSLFLYNCLPASVLFKTLFPRTHSLLELPSKCVLLRLRHLETHCPALVNHDW